MKEYFIEGLQTLIERRLLSEEQTRVRAYYHWKDREKDGLPGDDKTDWEKAQEDLLLEVGKIVLQSIKNGNRTGTLQGSDTVEHPVFSSGSRKAT